MNDPPEWALWEGDAAKGRTGGTGASRGRLEGSMPRFGEREDETKEAPAPSLFSLSCLLFSRPLSLALRCPNISLPVMALRC